MAFPGGPGPIGPGPIGPGIGGGFSGGIGLGGIGGSAGIGLGGLGLGGPGFGLDAPFPGWSPYVPVTPLGGLSAFKGDLAWPILIIGVAIFILIVIVLAVKAALLWKVDILKDLKERRRSIETPPPQDQEHMSNLASIVMNALDNQKCLERIICSVGTYGQGSSWPSWFSMMENLVSENYRPSLSVLKNCAEGRAKPEDFSCGNNGYNNKNSSGGSSQEPGQAGGAGWAGPGAKNSFSNDVKLNQSSPQWNSSNNSL